MSVVTPTRRAASRAPSSASRSNILPSSLPSPTPMVQDDIQIDPALLAEEAQHQEDVDAEGEVDDGVGYYLPVS